MYELIFSKNAVKQIMNVRAAKLDDKVNGLLAIIEKNPFQTPPSYEKLVWNFKGTYSRRINQKHRLVYVVDEKNKRIHILSMWIHYEK